MNGSKYWFKSTLQLIFIWSLLLNVSVNAADHPELGAFPEAFEGMERFVIVLPQESQVVEDNLMVELIVGKTVMTDGQNQMRLAASISAEALIGWGYTFYQVHGNGQMISTQMAVPPGTPMVETFVHGDNLLISYNSRLPIVIFAPPGYEIVYRFWETSSQLSIAEKG
jgi:ecotin